MNVLRTRDAVACLAYCGVAAAVLGGASAAAQEGCAGLPSHDQLQSALRTVVAGGLGDNGGLGNHMWGTLVNRDGQVCAVAFSGEARDQQWPGSRVISAQKANTANAFSLTGVYPTVGLGRALSTGNLYGLVLEGGSLFGLQFSNPVDAAAAYAGNGARFGQANDPLVGNRPGGVNVFGGGLPAYNADGALVGAVGVSGDTSCTDHIIAWKVRWLLNVDNIPGGVGDGGTTDNLILAADPDPNSFEHPPCGFGEEDIIADLNSDFPIGATPPEQE